MVGRYTNILIKGISAVVPSKEKNNKTDYNGVFLEKQVSKQIKMTGIQKRHYCNDNENVSDLSVKAAEILMKDLNWGSDDIDVLILVTQSPNFVLPSTAFYIQNQLNINKQCACFDMNLGCSGYVAGLGVIGSYLQGINKPKKRGLLLVSDTLTKYIDERDLSTCLLFGDAGTATAIEIEDNNDLLYSLYSDGTKYQSIYKDANTFLKMNGTEVFEFTIDQVADSIKECKNNFHIEDVDIDYYVFHQAQKFILGNLASILDIPDEKVLYSLDEYGNTAGATIPLTICHNRNLLQKKDKIKLLTAGFGVGLSWGCAFIQFDTNCIHDIEVL